MCTWDCMYRDHITVYLKATVRHPAKTLRKPHQLRPRFECDLRGSDLPTTEC
jgi:hypothetical protein